MLKTIVIFKKYFTMFLMVCFFVCPVYASQYRDHSAEFVDLLWHESNGPETIITLEGSSGIGHYKKVLRVFVDEGDQLIQVFEADLIDEHYYSGIYPDEHVAFISDVKYLEMNDEGVREILMTMTKYVFEDDRSLDAENKNEDDRFAWGGKIISEENLGTMHFYWFENRYGLLDGEVPEKIVKKYAYEDAVWEEIKQKGKKIGNMYFW